MNKKNISPIILTILDGWGYSETSKGNAIHLAETPTIDQLWSRYPNTLLNASGESVGLPNNQMGNSEVGHTTIGAGRIINQELVKISKSIDNKEFFSNPVIQKTYQHALELKSKIHLIGLCSNGGVHSHINHLEALIDISKTYNIQTCLHLILDGRDTRAKEAKVFIEQIINKIADYNNINTGGVFTEWTIGDGGGGVGRDEASGPAERGGGHGRWIADCGSRPCFACLA